MGFLRTLRLMGQAGPAAGHAAMATAAVAQVPSPATSAELPADVAWAFGLATADDAGPVTRQEAMRVPAVKRGRNVIAGTIGTLPLVARRAGDRGGAGPAGDDTVPMPLLDQPDPNLPRSSTITWTIDDLIFHGVSWWKVTARLATGYPLSAVRVPRERVGLVTVDGRLRVTMDGQVMADADVIRFDGPDEGLLENGAAELRTCLLLQAAVRNFARLDVPLGSLEPAEGAQPLDRTPGSSARASLGGDYAQLSEVDDLLDGWEDARRRRTTAYLTNVRYQTHQLDARSLQLAETRQHQVGEVARLLNLPPRFVAASSGDSLTYATSESERRDLVDLSFALYLTAVADRLSMGDVTPRGTTVQFDVRRFISGDLTTVGGLLDHRVIDVPEARDLTGLPPRTDLPDPPAAPSPAAGANSEDPPA